MYYSTRSPLPVVKCVNNPAAGPPTWRMCDLSQAFSLRLSIKRHLEIVPPGRNFGTPCIQSDLHFTRTSSAGALCFEQATTYRRLLRLSRLSKRAGLSRQAQEAFAEWDVWARNLLLVSTDLDAWEAAVAPKADIGRGKRITWADLKMPLLSDPEGR